MSVAAVSLCALLAAILLSCTSRLNVGILAIALAWGVGLYAERPAEAVLAGFPSALFVTLAGVTLLFAASEANGTMSVLAHRLLAQARGRAWLLPPLVFLIACVIASVGPGAIAAVALTAPLAMALAERAALPPFLVALMVANGANAGNLSPVSSVGIIANSRIAEAGLGSHPGKVWAANFLAHAMVAGAAYMALSRRTARGDAASLDVAPERLTRTQWLTAFVVAAWITGVVLGGLPIGLSAFCAAAILLGVQAADETAALKRMPWAAILMVSGMALLVAVVEKAGGLDLFTTLLARIATPATLNGVIAFVTGLISSYSSTSAVVLPTFLPLAPGLVAQVGGGDPLGVALSINVGASLVDVSPLSTLGALCVAALSDPGAAKDLFRKLLIWGLAMSVVGGVLCLLFADAFAGM